jgi:hypothetical protein
MGRNEWKTLNSTPRQHPTKLSYGPLAPNNYHQVRWKGRFATSAASGKLESEDWPSVALNQIRFDLYWCRAMLRIQLDQGKKNPGLITTAKLTLGLGRAIAPGLCW